MRPPDPQVSRKQRIVDFPRRSASQVASNHVMHCRVCMILVPFWSPNFESKQYVADSLAVFLNLTSQPHDLTGLGFISGLSQVPKRAPVSSWRIEPIRRVW